MPNAVFCWVVGSSSFQKVRSFWLNAVKRRRRSTFSGTCTRKTQAIEPPTIRYAYKHDPITLNSTLYPNKRDENCSKSKPFYLQIKSLKERESISTISRRTSKSVRALSIRKPKEFRLLMSEIWQQTKLLCRPPHLRNTLLTCAIQFGLTTRYNCKRLSPNTDCSECVV